MKLCRVQSVPGVQAILGAQFGAEVNVTMSNFLISRRHFRKKIFCSVHHLVNPHAEQCINAAEHQAIIASVEMWMMRLLCAITVS